MFGHNVLFVSLFFYACRDSEISTKSGLLYPNSLGKGTQARVALQLNNAFLERDSFFDFGKGVVVGDIFVQDSKNAVLDVYIQSNTDIGNRDILIVSEDKRLNIPKAYSIIDESFVVEPNLAKIGETLSIGILGNNTQWTEENLELDMGQHIEILDFTILSDTLAEAIITVSEDMIPGKHDIKIKDDEDDILTLFQGFLVERANSDISFSPKEMAQGEIVSFTLRSLQSNFFDEIPTIRFLDDSEPSNDITIVDVEVVDEHTILGHIWISNAAKVGYKSVEIEQEQESQKLSYAFAVVASPWEHEDVAVDVEMSIQRYVNTSCEFFEEIEAKANFYIPLQPACETTSLNSELMYTLDVNQFLFEEAFPSCPESKTISAGEKIVLESEGHSIELYKNIHPNTGRITYESTTLTLLDYQPRTTYDLRILGDINGVSEELIPQVLTTVPTDWEWIKPNLCDSPISRQSDLDMYWTPAQTQDYGFLEISLYGKLLSNSRDTILRVYPYDDGEHTFPASILLQLESGQGYLDVQSKHYGGFFGLSDSLIQDNQSQSFISYTTPLSLE